MKVYLVCHKCLSLRSTVHLNCISRTLTVIRNIEHVKSATSFGYKNQRCCSCIAIKCLKTYIQVYSLKAYYFHKQYLSKKYVHVVLYFDVFLTQLYCHSQMENGILLPTLQSALPFLDLHGTPRLEFHQSVFDELREKLMERVATIAEGKDEDRWKVWFQTIVFIFIQQIIISRWKSY